MQKNTHIINVLLEEFSKFKHPNQETGYCSRSSLHVSFQSAMVSFMCSWGSIIQSNAGLGVVRVFRRPG